MDMTTRRWRRSWFSAVTLALPLLVACGGAVAPATTSSPGAIAASGAAAAGMLPRASWSEVRGSGALPLPRDAQAMVYDSSSRKVVVFGGKGTHDRYFNDLWVYSPGGAWSQLSPRGALPSPRFGHGLVYDSSRTEIIAFGGVQGTTFQPAGDTWVYDPGTSTWRRSGAAGGGPAARLYPSTAYDATSRTTILFGGWTGSSAFDDTWSYDESTGSWTRVDTSGAPPARWGASMVDDPTTGRLILFGGLFGGYDGRSRLGDTWVYDPASRTWTDARPSGPVPPARAYAAMAYDRAIDRVILFGGFAGPQGLLGDTWAYDPATNRWSMLATGQGGPSVRDFSSMAYDEAANAIVLFGGQTGSSGNVQATDLDDTWLLRI
jgi:N-acetylneuraminic acid mutarotase